MEMIPRTAPWFQAEVINAAFHSIMSPDYRKTAVKVNRTCHDVPYSKVKEIDSRMRRNMKCLPQTYMPYSLNDTCNQANRCIRICSLPFLCSPFLLFRAHP